MSAQDLEQFRVPVQAWKDKVLLPLNYSDHDAQHHAEADRLLALIDNAGKAACATCGGRGEVGGHTGQTPEQFEFVTEPCPECAKQSEAVDEDAAARVWEAMQKAGYLFSGGPLADAHPDDQQHAQRIALAAIASQPAPVVDDAMRELIDAADKAKRAYWLARNSAAGLTNYCEESANSRRCERELDEAERIYRDSGFEAALARAQGVQS